MAAVKGLFRSGMMEKWNAEVEKDKKKLSTILNNAPDPEENIEKLSQSVLELKLIENHKFQKEVTDIKEKYIAERQKDDEERKQIREDHRSLQQHSNT